MEQLKYCQKLLTLYEYPYKKLKYIGHVGSYELILFTLSLSIILAVYLREANVIYILLGFLLPLYLQSYGIKV